MILCAIFLSCESQDATTYTDVNNSKLKEMLSTGGYAIIDVRTDEEVAHGMIDGATHIDIYSDDFEAQMKALDPSKPTIVYCKAGGRSAQAAEMMIGWGFSEVYNLEGGYDGWKDE